MNRRSFFAGIAALLPLGWFKRKKPTIHECLSKVVPCPWCGKRCMYAEKDVHYGIRICADCHEHFEAYLKPVDDDVSDRSYADLEQLCNLYGKNFGRTNWCSTIEEAIEDWNDRVRAGNKTNQQGVW